MLRWRAPRGSLLRGQRPLGCSEEFLYAHAWISEDQRSEAVEVWNVHYNYHRPHSAVAGEPPASRLRQGVANVLASYT